MYRLFSWEHSYFSGKVRAYLRHKDRASALGEGFEDILATPELIQGLLTPRSGSGAVPQLLAPDGTWIQDSSEIIDYCEAAHPDCAVLPDSFQQPVQSLVSYLIELLADEWMVVPGFWERWFFSEDGRSPSHRAFNEQQWGAPHCCSLKARWLGERPSSEKNHRSQKPGTTIHSSARSSIK